MQNVLQRFLENKQMNKKKHTRFLAFILALSVGVSTAVFWSMRQRGVAMAGEASCGIPEHTHAEQCQMNCTQEEHTHDLQCYCDESADVEDRLTWELSLWGTTFSEDYGADLVAVARTQLGYRESTANFLINEQGQKQGYTRYGAWYGNPYGEWSSMFVSFCLYYTGIPLEAVPMNIGAESARLAWEKLNCYLEADAHKAQAGDLIFLKEEDNAGAKYLGIVSRIEGEKIYVIYGDVNDVVEEAAISTDEGGIMGYVAADAVMQQLNTQGIKREQRSVALPKLMLSTASGLTSAEQIIKHGGVNKAADGTSVSKIITGTDIENIFDITLTVETQQKIEQVYTEPNMAVVVVMDISNTMRYSFGDTTRYAAAMEAAEDFIYHFAEVSGSVSQLGYVAFNTDAHKIFELQNCSTTAKAKALINEMKTDTGKIINASGYATSRSRYTNVEAGLKMGWDMIKNSPCEHKYIIFLSDGFPTTYLKNHNGTNYVGYEPYSTSGTVGKDGVFYDSVKKRYLDAGASYSDKAAIYARQRATTIKNEGGVIFSIGVDIGGQTIKQYIDQSHPVVDRTGTSYEIGSATSSSSYKTWLKNQIGSGYYYDSTDTAGLKAAYEAIFNEIQHIREEESKAEWIACDPLPIMEDSSFKTVEFIGFYNKSGDLIPMSSSGVLAGTHTSGGENSAVFSAAADQIDWDLKESGYSSTTSGSVTTYKYLLKYRVRLRNEDTQFNEYTEYYTNDVTTLAYRIIETVNGQAVVSQNKTLNFPLPSVEGYLGELTFTKVDPHGNGLAGAEFTLSHDTVRCNLCHGDGTAVQTIPHYKAVSDENGTVTFTGIPSGHVYSLTETVIPTGYLDPGRQYKVTVAYDHTTVNVASVMGEALAWDGTVLNLIPYGLPSTGGTGSFRFVLIGSVLVVLSIVGLLLLRKEEKASRK